MENRSINPVKLLVSACIIAVFILLGTLYAYYRNSLLHLSGHIDKDYFPAFGSFVGSTIGVVLSIVSVLLIFYTYQSQQEQLHITKGLVDRQISLSIKPELVVDDFDNYKNSESKKEEGMLIPGQIKDINLRIINIGVEAAQYIEYGFEFDVKQLADYMLKNVPEPLLDFSYEEGATTASFRRIDKNEHKGFINILGPLKTSQKGFLLPYKLDSSAFYVLFPYPYILFYFYTFLGINKGKIAFDSELKGFPKCFFHLSYQDLEGNKHVKKFDLLVDYKGGSRLSTPEDTAIFNIEIVSKDMARNH